MLQHIAGEVKIFVMCT